MVLLVVLLKSKVISSNVC